MPQQPNVCEFTVSFDLPNITKEDAIAINNIFRHPSVVKYLKFLESQLLNDYHKIPLEDLLLNRDHMALKQAFLMGNINMSQTLLAIHKDNTIINPTQGNTNATGSSPNQRS